MTALPLHAVLGILISSSVLGVHVAVAFAVAASVGPRFLLAGLLTPPFGLGCFVVKACVPDRQPTLREVFVGATPYWIMILILAAVVHAIPSLHLAAEPHLRMPLHDEHADEE